MGYMRHHAIIVTAGSHSGGLLTEAHRIACLSGGVVSPIMRSGTNGYQSFTLFPDGSKEGWYESLRGDKVREVLIEYLVRQRYSDGSSPLQWVEVQYGDENRETKVIRHSDEDFSPAVRLQASGPDKPIDLMQALKDALAREEPTYEEGFEDGEAGLSPQATGSNYINGHMAGQQKRLQEKR